MCGIVGIWNFNSPPLHSKTLDSFVDSLVHRGPDGRGIYRSKDYTLSLGHRRLNILDISDLATQPLSYLNRYWITFNGEIYNFIELKKELQGHGYRFQTTSDTEVILAAYDYFGEECQHKFNGMWAFAIWDEKEQTLFLSRDRFGVKPLHYTLNEKFFAFGSEMKAFLHLPDFVKIFDEKTIALTLLDGNATESQEETLLKGIKKLQAGHSLTFSKKGMKIKKWWNTLDHLQEIPEKTEDQIDQLRALFLDACQVRMRSDVPLGCALSGGLDSSSIVSTLATLGKNERDRQAKEWHHAFVALFPDTSQDEFSYAKKVIEHTHFSPHYVEVRGDQLLKNLDMALFQFEDIFDLPIAPWLLYREFRKKGIFISIDGHGADELFGGYHHHVEEAMLQNFNNLIAWKKEFVHLYPNGSPFPLPTWKKLLTQKVQHSLPKKLKKIVKRFYTVSPETWLKNYKKIDFPLESCKKFDRLNQRLFLDFHMKTLPTILRNFDRVSMAHGIEIRAPFLDYRLVAFAFSLPSNVKIKNGYTKWILREAMKGILPEEIRVRKSKIGFASPVTEWFSGPLKEFVFDQVHSHSFLNSPIWKGHLIKEHIENCYKNKDFHGARKAWEYILANRWMEIFK